MNEQLELMLEYVNKQGYNIKGKMTQAQDIIFEERVKMNCFYCGKYNKAWRCPPRLPDIDMKKMLLEYEFVAFIYISMCLEGQDYLRIRTDSSVQLHRALLECERWLYKHNNSMALSFIGGSCKLCKNGCAPNGCANPYESRAPVEALGVNVIRSAEKAGIKVTFPPEKYMMRIGMLLW